MWYIINLSGTVGWLEKKTPGFFKSVSLWDCGTASEKMGKYINNNSGIYGMGYTVVGY